MNIDPSIRQRIRRDFEAVAAVRDACLRIVEWMEGQETDAIRYLTYRRLQNIANASSEETFEAAQYLSGSIRLLTPKFEFIEDEFIDQIEAEELLEARKTGKFYHPGTGQPVQDFESHIYMYFVPSSGGESR